LGRFKLTGIPPAPRGIPQIQVAFDIDANGILQVTARDRTTGREQSVTIAGASTLSEGEVNRMIREASEFAEQDRERRERIEKRNRAKSLVDQTQRRLKEITLDFGSQFTSSYRRQIESISAEILDSLEKNDDRRLDRAQADLQDVLYELNREVRLQYEDEEDEGFFETIRRTFTGDSEDDFPTSAPPRRSTYRDDYRSSREEYRPKPDYKGYDNYYDERDPYSSRLRPRPRNTNMDMDTDTDRYPLRDNRDPRSRSRNLPYENDWDEEDDDWF
jgi:molecular chaperone DnaK